MGTPSILVLPSAGYACQFFSLGCCRWVEVQRTSSRPATLIAHLPKPICDDSGVSGGPVYALCGKNELDILLCPADRRVSSEFVEILGICDKLHGAKGADT